MARQESKQAGLPTRDLLFSPCPTAPAGAALERQKELAAEPSALLPPLQKLLTAPPRGGGPRDHSSAYGYLLNSNFQHLPSLTSNAPSASPEASVTGSWAFTGMSVCPDAGTRAPQNHSVIQNMM